MGRDDLRANFLRFTEKAFGLLSPMDRPRILDLGCGTGVPTLRLAALSGGQVVALDSDEEALGVLRAGAERLGLAGRIEVRAGSVEDVPFADGSFDLLWCEGAVFPLGFRGSLRSWRRLLKPGGCMVLHDEAGDIEEKLATAVSEGYVVLGHFEIPPQVWWDEYFALADEDPELAGEISRFHTEPERFRSAFFVLQRGDPE